MSKAILIYEPDSVAHVQTYAAAVTRAAPGLRLVATSERGAALAAAPTTTAVIAKAQDVLPELVAAMPALDWIQALTTGIDPLIALKLPRSVTVTTTRGMHAPQMAELAFLLMLSLSRNAPQLLANQREARWKRWGQHLLLGKTVTIVGVGSISEALALRCRAFGIRVLGISSRTSAEGFDELHPRARLREVAARSDFVVVLAPYTTETHHLIDAAVLGAMRDTAFLINIARGNVVDEPALIEALKAGTIAGAGLDVFATEPLPATSPLWTLDNVIVTPHIGGLSDIYAEQALPILLHNLQAYVAGDLAAMQNRIGRDG
jgi:phosphoglycerate dehydrogenase-like enzyme